MYFEFVYFVSSIAGDVNSIQDGPFWGCSRMRMGVGLSHISYNDETWEGYTLLKEDPKNI